MAQQVLADMEHRPGIIHIDQGHYGKTLRGQLAGLEQQLLDLTVMGAVDGGVGGQGAHLALCSLGDAHPGGGGLLVLLPGPFERQEVGLVGGLGAVAGGGELGLRLVALLGGHDSVAKEVVDPGEGLFCQVGGGLGLAPLVLGGGDLLAAGALLHRFGHGGGGLAAGGGLGHLGIELGALQGEDQLSLLHRVPLADMDSGDSPRNLGGDGILLRLYLPLDDLRLRLVGPPEGGGDKGRREEGEKDDGDDFEQAHQRASCCSDEER